MKDVAEVVGLMPAAGKGERLGLPFPKELWPLPSDGGFFPVASCTVRNMTAAHVRQIVVVTRAAKPAIMEYFGDGSRWGASIGYVCQENFGTAGKSSGLSEALDSAFHWVRNKVVVFGMPDTIVEPSDCFAPLVEAVQSGSDLALGLFPTDKPEKFGMVRLGLGGRVSEIIDKPRQTELEFMWGITAWSPRFTEHLHEVMRSDPTDFASVVNRGIGRNLTVTGIEIRGGRYIDLGTYDDLMRLHEFLGRESSLPIHRSRIQLAKIGWEMATRDGLVARQEDTEQAVEVSR